MGLLASIFYATLASLMIPIIQLSDNVAYEHYFYSSLRLSYENSKFGIGYYFLNKFMVNFVEYEIFRALFIVFTLSVKIYLLFRTTKFILLALAFYFAFQFYVDSYLVRASFATSFALIALFYRFKGQPIIGGLFLTVAITFHLSTIAVVPLWILANLKISRRLHLVIFLSLFVFSQFPLAELTAELLMLILPNSSGVVKLFSYVGSTHGEAAGILRGSILMYSFIHICFLLLVDRNEAMFSDLNSFVLNCMLFAIFFLLVFNDMVVISDRISRFTLFFYVIGVTIVVGSLSQGKRALAYCFLGCFGILSGLILDEGPYDII